MSVMYIKNDEGVFVPILTIKGDQGDSLQFLWDGTELGVKTDKEAEYEYVDLKGTPGVNSDMYKAVYDVNNEARDVFAYDNTISGLDATKVKTALDELSLYSHTHINLIDPTKLLNGYINATTGALQAGGASCKATDFLPVTAGEVYSSNATSTTKTAFYDTNKSFISLASTDINFTVPANALYMSLTFSVSLTPNPMLNTGATLLTYVPYAEPELKLKTGYIRNGIIKDFMTDSAVTAYVNAMVKTQNQLYGLKWGCIGDSQTQYGNSGRTDGVGGTSYMDYIAQRTGAVLYNHGIGGTTYCPFAGQLNPSYIERYTNMPADLDIVTVAGGTNDIGKTPLGTMADRTSATFYGGCHVLYVGISERYVGKRVGIISPVFTANASLPAYIAAQKEVAAYYSIPYCDIYSAGGITSNLPNTLATLMPDGLHPSALGRLIESRKIEAFLKAL